MPSSQEMARRHRGRRHTAMPKVDGMIQKKLLSVHEPRCRFGRFSYSLHRLLLTCTYCTTPRSPRTSPSLVNNSYVQIMCACGFDTTRACRLTRRLSPHVIMSRGPSCRATHAPRQSNSSARPRQRLSSRPCALSLSLCHGGLRRRTARQPKSQPKRPRGGPPASRIELIDVAPVEALCTWTGARTGTRISACPFITLPACASGPSRP